MSKNVVKSGGVGNDDPPLSLKEIQWNLRQEHDWNFLMKGGHCKTNARVKR